MSGVYIKGMEMPTGCSGCPIDSDICTLWQELPPERLRDTRPAECPLVPVPPHGDLIDRDALKKQGYFFPCAIGSEYAIPLRALREAPTIIPAEEGQMTEHIQMSLFDEEIIHPNCTVQELRNTETGEVSFGWWENENPPKGVEKDEPDELAVLRAYYEEISSLPDCNTCMQKGVCEFRPRPGEHCRINCPAWVGERKEEK